MWISSSILVSSCQIICVVLNASLCGLLSPDSQMAGSLSLSVSVGGVMGEFQRQPSRNDPGLEEIGRSLSGWKQVCSLTHPERSPPLRHALSYIESIFVYPSFTF